MGKKKFSSTDGVKKVDMPLGIKGIRFRHLLMLDELREIQDCRETETAVHFLEMLDEAVRSAAVATITHPHIHTYTRDTEVGWNGRKDVKNNTKANQWEGGRGERGEGKTYSNRFS